jgi:ATP-binding cassette, subfamily B, bacterial
LKGGFTFLSGRLAAQTAEGIARRLRNYLYDHIQRLTFSYHDRMQTGELIQRSTSDVDALRRFYSDQAIGIGRIILLFIINFAALARLNLRLALLSVIVVPLIVVVSGSSSSASRAPTRSTRSRRRRCPPCCRRT